jgi:hypothetical protein
MSGSVSRKLLRNRGLTKESDTQGADLGKNKKKQIEPLQAWDTKFMPENAMYRPPCRQLFLATLPRRVDGFRTALAFSLAIFDRGSG